MDAAALIDKLKGADRRSIGRSEEVVCDVLAEPALFSALIDAMTTSDPVVRMRAADAAEKVTRRRSDLLVSCKQRLLDEVAAVPQQEVRWHVAQMLPRLALTTAERAGGRDPDRLPRRRQQHRADLLDAGARGSRGTR